MVSPLSKIQHQKQRRTIAGQQPNPFNFDPNSITSGTEFMFKLDSYLKEFFVTQQRRLVPRLIYSSHVVPGEGEHKIMRIHRSGERHEHGNHELVGMDVDLVILAMLFPLSNIIIA